MTEWEDERDRFWKFSVPNGSFQYFTALLKKCLWILTVALGKMKGQEDIKPS